MSKSFTAVAVVVALIAGYVISLLINQQQFTAGGSCGGNYCAGVTVKNGKISDIPDIKVQGGNVVITWTIGTQGYTFPANGIGSFTPTPPAGEFQCVNSATVFTCIDKNTVSGSGPKRYKYTVTLDGSPPATPLDPYIINN